MYILHVHLHTLLDIKWAASSRAWITSEVQKARLLTSPDSPVEGDATCDLEATFQSVEPPGQSAPSAAAILGGHLLGNKLG